MGNNTMAFFSLVMAVIFIVGGIQVLGGKTGFLGENVESSIRPEYKNAYCREISIPIFLLGIVEAADAVMQFTMDTGGWSMVILGVGILLAFGWIMLIQKKYSKK